MDATAPLRDSGAPSAENCSVDRRELDDVIGESCRWLGERQNQDGHWVFELEADATIPAEYILLNHFLDEIDDAREARIASYLRAIQGKHGGWPLFHDGDFDMSATVKAYYALKLTGDGVDEPHMVRARQAILEHGGAERTNVFTRFTLAMFDQVPWRACPVTPVEALLLPRFAPFHWSKVSYWSRTVMTPLMILYSRRARAVNPRGIGVRELFRRDPEVIRDWLKNPTGHWIGDALIQIDKVLRVIEPAIHWAFRDRAEKWALDFIEERLNGRDGLGGIYPAIANTLMAYHTLGYAKDHPGYRIAREAVDGLCTPHAEGEYVQPCLSPVWDTCLASHAIQEAGQSAGDQAVDQSNAWLRERQVLDVVGDWKSNRGHLRPGGWAFQYNNPHYPDVDDTAVVVMALARSKEDEANREAIARAEEWIIGMQSSNGGWGAFDAENEHDFLNHVPFADHGALLDPPTVDVSARCLGMLAQLGRPKSDPVVARGLDYLWREQEADGSWFGRWGTNYIYGTWSALNAFNAVEWDMTDPRIRQAVDWLKSRQRDDGGWGEDCATYWKERRSVTKASTPSQTAWAVLGLMAAGEVDSPEVERGIRYLLEAPRDGGKWQEELYNAVGFPRIFYLRYHGYSAYFPLWALARYRNLTSGNCKRTIHGM
ncbi:squalene--hopene cyclase [Rhodospirillum rubrum]|uniref:squalene--hopene cyclase n=1 Tax=Rhodospirillum rubrum TaxID=1085 RepID=UPI001904745A|nr:squalene--hopene cyclase [Rhodospirillum rubrum]MBK1665421.1 squalene--hopene cyclase [Rhodospirillum rubrum]MBK1677250.1 squalene--hopene cyclase [Rhodospirillum rubrum]